MIVLCVTGSIAATESIKLARELKRNDMDVKCFMSEAACEIIHPNAMEFATGNEVVTKLTGKIEHVRYSQEDLILVAPATANTISKFAYKIADDPISTLLITAYGHDTPIIFVPSMHDSMYKAIKENIENRWNLNANIGNDQCQISTPNVCFLCKRQTHFSGGFISYSPYGIYRFICPSETN